MHECCGAEESCRSRFSPGGRSVVLVCSSEFSGRGHFDRRNNDADIEPYVPIGCGDYEYIELACMDRYEVEVVKQDGTVRGLAVTTEANDTGEYLIVELGNKQRKRVRVDHIKKIIVRSKERRFDEHTFEPLIDPH